MPHVGPIARRKFVAALRRAGFAGPFAGGRHEFMTRGAVRLIVPNPHRGDISDSLLRELLKQAGISRSEWERL